MDVQDQQIPIIDLSDITGPGRAQIVQQVRHATEKWGFYQVVNHSIPLEVCEKMIESVRLFNEGDKNVEAKKYSCENTSKIQFQSDLNLGTNGYPNWRDSLVVDMAPDPPTPEEVPTACRDILFEYVKHSTKLAETLCGLLSEAIGFEADYLKDIGCMSGLRVISHYYPPCPQPELTFGTNRHTDPCFLTILLQDRIGGLQVFQEDTWVDVPPVHGALVINNGDLLQLITNDKLKSMPHRVLANKIGPRLSVACFYSAYKSNREYGPLKELISADEKPVYKETTVDNYFLYYITKSGDFTTTLTHFKV